MQTSHDLQQEVRDNIQKLCDEPLSVSDKEKDIRAYVLEKSLRIAAAVLALAALLDKTSSVQGALERTSIGLIEGAGHGLTQRSARSDLLAHLRTLGALLDAAMLAGLVAPTNRRILTDEIAGFTDILTRTGWTQGRVAQAAALLSVAPVDPAFMDEQPTQRTQTYKGHTLRTYDPEGPQSPAGVVKDAPQALKDMRAHGPQVYRERVHDTQKDRRATLLALLQRKDRISVRDAAAVIKDCSEKTLQRELLALVAQGVLVKDGERRWSTYRLA